MVVDERKLKFEIVMNFLLQTFIFNPEQTLETPADMIFRHTK